MRIGKIEIERTAALAPMAGVADSAFRQICKQFGAAYMVGEMASAKGMHYSDRKTARLLGVRDTERPVAVQLFGDEPEIVAEAAKKALAFCPDVIDINMGCPAPKVAGNGGGSALMKNVALAARITEATVKAVGLPVTVKFRKGWDDEHVNAVEFARAMEQSGAAALTVHGRTRMQYYAPPVDLDIIAAVKDAVSIPVIGNGDVASGKDAERMFQETGCDGIMIGRAAQGNPWIFRDLITYEETGEEPAKRTADEVREMMLRHAKLQIRYKGDYTAIREMRKHVAWYTSGFPNSAKLRDEINHAESYEELEALLNDRL